MPDIIVVIPGIMGSVLSKGGQDVWAPSGGAVVRALKSLGGNIKQLALDEHDDGTLDDLGDGVEATRLMPDVHLVPKLWSIDGYGSIRETIMSTFEVTEGRNYFEFPYDWRRHNGAHARRLRELSRTWLADWRTSSGNEHAKLVILAHSMGGLVARAFLELEDGHDDTRSVLTFGTPFAGSLNALNFVANGFEKKLGPFGIDLSDMLRSFTSIYQLLPTFACIDAGGDEPVRCADAAVPHLDPERATHAAAFHAALTASAAERQANKWYPVVGIRQPTLQRAVLRNDSLWVSSDWDPQRPATHIGGDGTVPRWSAVPAEMHQNLRGTMYSAVRHGSLQNARSVLTHVEGVLTEAVLEQTFQQAAGAQYLSLDLDDDTFRSDEPIEVRCASNSSDAFFQVTVTDTESGENVHRTAIDNINDEPSVSTTIPPLDEGTYRVGLSSPGTDAAPVSMLISVWG